MGGREDKELDTHSLPGMREGPFPNLLLFGGVLVLRASWALTARLLPHILRAGGVPSFVSSGRGLR